MAKEKGVGFCCPCFFLDGLNILCGVTWEGESRGLLIYKVKVLLRWGETTHWNYVFG